MAKKKIVKLATKETERKTKEALQDTKKTAQEAVKLLERQAELQQKVSGSYDDFLKGVKEYNNLQKSINKLDALKAKYEAESKDKNEDISKLGAIKLKVVEKELELLRKQSDALKDALATTKKLQLAGVKLISNLAKFGKFVDKGFGKLENGMNLLKPLFEMEKAVKTSALQMGILSKGADSFRSNIVNAAEQTVFIGVSVKELAQIQASYSDEIGRTVELSEKGLVALGQMAASTMLGAEGSAKMAADMENQGISAERTGQFVEQTLNDSHKMGLNASKVLKNITGGFKMINKYNFKDGVKGLEKMAMTVTKMGVSMEFAAGMSDKLWNVEGAVDMAAQLQVMGGAWSQIADPFHLMYMARNDMEGLTKEIGQAASASAKFNKTTGEFDVAAKEMHRLKLIADQTGVSYDELVTAAKNVKKFAIFDTQLKINTSDKDGKALKEYINSKATLNGQGQGEITIKGNPKLLNALSQQDKDILMQEMKQKASMKERAEQSQTFDEQLKYFFDGIKINLLPIVQEMNKTLIPKLSDLIKKFTSEEWGKKIEAFATSVGQIVSTIAGWMISWPKLTAGLFLFGKIGPTIFNGIGAILGSVKWFLNGMALAKGFISGVKGTGTGGTGTGGTGTGGKGTGGKGTGGTGTGGKGSKLSKGMRIAGGIGMGLGIVNSTGLFGKEGSTTNQIVGGLSSALTYGEVGAELGSLIAPGIGTAIGAIAGGLAGLYMSNAMYAGEETHDGIFPGKNLGSDFSKNRGLIQGGKIHPIDNKDDLLAMKPRGVVDNNMNGSTTIKHEFDELRINGEIILRTANNSSISMDLLKDPQFRVEITRVIQSQLEQNRNGGKNKG